MTAAVAHVEDGRLVLDVALERRPPFSPEAVVTEYAATFAQYGVTLVVGDRYAGEWPRERFAAHGIEYVVAGRPKAELYRDTLPLLNSGRVELLDHPRLLAQLLGLERRTSRGGRDSIDHAPGGHDDLANAACGALLLAQEVAAGVTGEEEDLHTILAREVTGNFLDWMDDDLDRAERLRRFRESW
jgi:hypothetical protein